MQTFEFLLVAQFGGWKGVRTLWGLMFTEAHRNRGVRELSFSHVTSFFSTNLEHQLCRSFSLSLLLCLCPSLSCGLPPSLPYCAFLHVSFCLGCYPAHRAKEKGVILMADEKGSWWLNTLWMKEKWKDLCLQRKQKKRERWVSSTNFCGQECQVTLPVLLQQLLLSPIPVHAPPCAQKQQNLRETHTQTHCFSITLSSWTGCIMVPLLAATSFCGTEQHCLVSFLLSGVLLQECCTILYPKNSNPKIVFLCLSRCMDMSCSLSAGQVLPIFCFLSWFSSAKSIQTAVLLSQGLCQLVPARAAWEEKGISEPE